MLKPKFYGTAKNNKFVFDNPDDFALWMSRFKDGKELEMTVAPKYKRRTSGQPGEDTNFNGYYWGVLIRLIADEVGDMDSDWIHHWVQIAIGNFQVMPDGTKVPKGTAEMSGAEFAEMCTRARTWAGTPGNITEHGIYIPEPYEVVGQI